MLQYERFQLWITIGNQIAREFELDETVIDHYDAKTGLRATEVRHWVPYEVGQPFSIVLLFPDKNTFVLTRGAFAPDRMSFLNVEHQLCYRWAERSNDNGRPRYGCYHWMETHVLRRIVPSCTHYGDIEFEIFRKLVVDRDHYADEKRFGKLELCPSCRGPNNVCLSKTLDWRLPVKNQYTPLIKFVFRVAPLENILRLLSDPRHRARYPYATERPNRHCIFRVPELSYEDFQKVMQAERNRVRRPVTEIECSPSLLTENAAPIHLCFPPPEDVRYERHVITMNEMTSPRMTTMLDDMVNPKMRVENLVCYD